MNRYREFALDEAVSAAKSWSHDAVDPRHILVGLIRTLGDRAPEGTSPSDAQRLLDPHGTSIATPTVSNSAETELERITSEEAAIEVCADLASRLLTESGRDQELQSRSAAEASARATQDVQVASVPIQPAKGVESADDILAEFDDLVGLAPVKSSVRRLIAVQRLNAERRDHGLPVVNANNHIVFTGDPGTGKTTVARLIARLYGAIGVVSNGHLVEVSRADLVAGYVGQTALKVKDAVDRAVGGVLFIDEAYALSNGGGVDYGNEAVATLVKLMEDHRDNLAVIAAGYPTEMRAFIASNPGLRSRFTHYVEFPNYETDELVTIFLSIARQSQVELTEDAKSRLPELFKAAQTVDDFGNARFVRSAFEIAYANMAHRALEDGRIEPHEMHQMIAVDLPVQQASESVGAPRIGFRPR